MAEVIIMPKLGFNMDEGQLVKWHKKVGDPVAKGEVLFEINTDKTTMPVEATLDGVVLKIMLAEGEFAAVFTPIAVIGQAGEDPDAALAAASGDAPAASPTAPAAGLVIDAVTAPTAPGEIIVPAVDVRDLKLTPKARKLIKDEGIDPASLAGIQGSGFQGGITAKDIKASPLARKLADRSGVDIAAVAGTGAGGKVMKADVQAAASAMPSPAAQPVPSQPDADKQVLSTAPYKGVRKIIGDRLAQSKFTAPHLYFTDSVDTTALTAFRAQLNAAGDAKIAVIDLFVLAASKALTKYPAVNASLVNDQIVCYKSTNIGMAVAGDNGLIVPVVKNAQEKPLLAIAAETRDLVERAKAGRLLPEEFSCGTFTISNLGMFGIENFTAIINPPESAILSVSSVRKKPVVVTGPDGEDAVVVRPMMNIQLTVDHRIIDGLLAAQFVRYFKDLLENPVRILM